MAAPVSSLRPIIIAQAPSEADAGRSTSSDPKIGTAKECTAEVARALEKLAGALKAGKITGKEVDSIVGKLAGVLGNLNDILRSCAPSVRARGVQSSPPAEDSAKYFPIVIPIILVGSQAARDAALQMIDRALQNLSRGAAVFATGASRFSAGFSSALLPLSLIPEGSLGTDSGLFEGSTKNPSGIY